MTSRNLRQNEWMVAIICVFILAVAAMAGPAASSRPASSFQAQSDEYKELPPHGKKCRLDDSFYFTYEFSEKPKMGTVILKVQVFDQGGQKNASFVVTGRYDMPTMNGAHDSGEQEFKLNKKNDYLLPVTVVMRGEWEVKLTLVKDGTPVFRGFFRFNV